MRLKGPIITLLAGLLVAGVLYVLNLNLSNDVTRRTAGQASAAATTAPPATAAPAGTATAKAPASTAPPAQGRPTTYAGTVDGGAAGLAIVVANGRVLAYVCDGKTAEAWLSGSAIGGQLVLNGPKGSLTGTYANGVATGTVTAGTKRWPFTIRIALPPSGLYRSAANVRQRLDASWAVMPGANGQQQFGLAWNAGVPSTAPDLDTSTKTATVDGTAVPVDSPNP